MDDNGTIRLMLAYLCISKESEASLVRKVEILDRFGLKDDEIAQVCGASSQSIRNSRLILKKANNGKAKGKKATH